jgi:hypothetical protein
VEEDAIDFKGEEEQEENPVSDFVEACFIFGDFEHLFGFA